ncbi:MAG: hypothetical protein JNK85_04555 [Verrucomicrobiales bacterium]|nr:hypothetical protein [Verrucomicrobiales bacterium]
MNLDWSAILKLGLRDATLWLLMVISLLGLRCTMERLGRLARRHGWRLGLDDEVGVDESDRMPTPREARWGALIYAAIPLGWGLFRLAQGRYAQRSGGRLHPNPPIYLYEGPVAVADALSWIVGGIAIYLAFAFWHDLRRRWLIVGLTVCLTCTAGVLHQVALAGRVYLR